MILGAVLAGGRSTRYGSDKAVALWHGVQLVDHVIGRLATVAAAIVVCGREHSGANWIVDRPGPDLGPLGGLNAALHHAAAGGFEWVITAPCDTPELDGGLLSILAAARGDAFLVGMPVIGCWRSSRAALLDEHLRSSGDRSMRSWARLVDAVSLDHPSPPNVNFPVDLESLGGR